MPKTCQTESKFGIFRSQKGRYRHWDTLRNLWVVAKGLHLGDVVLMPLGNNEFAAGEVTGPYTYAPGTNVPHRRAVRWVHSFSKDEMSSELQSSTLSYMTAFSLARHGNEIQSLISNQATSITTSDPSVEDAAVFALEKHLEDFLVANWASTPLALEYEIFSEDGVVSGRQYPTDTGPLDILAVSKDKSKLLVIELKKGRASDVVVGQVQRYMGYVKDELAEQGQTVHGLIIALENDVRVKRALSVTSNIEFMTYTVSFALHKQS